MDGVIQVVIFVEEGIFLPVLPLFSFQAKSEPANYSYCKRIILNRAGFFRPFKMRRKL